MPFPYPPPETNPQIYQPPAIIRDFGSPRMRFLEPIPNSPGEYYEFDFSNKHDANPAFEPKYNFQGRTK